jgi:hypothetical protein
VEQAPEGDVNERTEGIANGPPGRKLGAYRRGRDG